MDALKHKVHTAYKVREPNPRSLHPNEPLSPLPPARAPPSSPFLFKLGARYALMTHPMALPNRVHRAWRSP